MSRSGAMKVEAEGVGWMAVKTVAADLLARNRVRGAFIGSHDVGCSSISLAITTSSLELRAFETANRTRDGFMRVAEIPVGDLAACLWSGAGAIVPAACRRHADGKPVASRW